MEYIVGGAQQGNDIVLCHDVLHLKAGDILPKEPIFTNGRYWFISILEDAPGDYTLFVKPITPDLLPHHASWSAPLRAAYDAIVRFARDSATHADTPEGVHAGIFTAENGAIYIPLSDDHDREPLVRAGVPDSLIPGALRVRGDDVAFVCWTEWRDNNRHLLAT